MADRASGLRSRIAVDELHKRWKRVFLITGDAQQVADGVAEGLGIDDVFAEILPHDKDSKVAELQARGLTVDMVGEMIQNLVLATGYNLIGIPIAAGVFAFADLNLPPAAAALAMSVSTMAVAANAQFLRRLNLRPEPLPDTGKSSPIVLVS